MFLRVILKVNPLATSDFCLYEFSYPFLLTAAFGLLPLSFLTLYRTPTSPSPGSTTVTSSRERKRRLFKGAPSVYTHPSAVRFALLTSHRRFLSFSTFLCSTFRVATAPNPPVVSSAIHILHLPNPPTLVVLAHPNLHLSFPVVRKGCRSAEFVCSSISRRLSSQSPSRTSSSIICPSRFLSRESALKNCLNHPL
jgi:hypothetical protein